MISATRLHFSLRSTLLARMKADVSPATKAHSHQCSSGGGLPCKQRRLGSIMKMWPRRRLNNCTQISRFALCRLGNADFPAAYYPSISIASEATGKPESRDSRVSRSFVNRSAVSFRQYRSPSCGSVDFRERIVLMASKAH